MPIDRRILVGLLLAGRTAVAAEAGDITSPFSLGANVYTHRFAAEGKMAADTTIANGVGLSEFPGIGYFVSDRLRLGLNLQFTEALTNPPQGGAFTTFALLPQINFNFWGPFTASLVPTFVLRLAGVDQFGFNVQAVLAYGVSLGAGFSLQMAVEVPFYFVPMVSVGITPLVGVVYRLPRS